MVMLTTKIDDNEQKITKVSPKNLNEFEKVDQISYKKVSRAPTKSTQGWVNDHRSERCMTKMRSQIAKDRAQMRK